MLRPGTHDLHQIIGVFPAVFFHKIVILRLDLTGGTQPQRSGRIPGSLALHVILGIPESSRTAGKLHEIPPAAAQEQGNAVMGSGDDKRYPRGNQPGSCPPAETVTKHNGIVLGG